MKMLITLELFDIFCSNFVYLRVFIIAQNGDKASPSIILAGKALLVKMLITLELHGIFGSNFVYSFILTLSSDR